MTHGGGSDKVRRMFHSLAVALTVLVLYSGSSSAAPALAGPPPQSAESALLDQWVRSQDEVFYDDTTGLVIAEWLETHDMSDEFYGEVVTSNLSSELETSSLWVGLVEDQSGPSGMAVVDEGSSWYVMTTLGQDVASDVAAALQEGDSFWYMEQGNQFFLVRGETAIPLGVASKENLGGSSPSLRDVQVWWSDNYGQPIPAPVPTGGGSYRSGEVAVGGGGSAGSRQTGDPSVRDSGGADGAVMFGLIALAVVAATVWWRRTL